MIIPRTHRGTRRLVQLRRIRATSNHSRDIAPVNMGHSVDEFFDVLAEDLHGGAKLPNWSGELYLEVRPTLVD